MVEETTMHACMECGTPGVVPPRGFSEEQMLRDGWQHAYHSLWLLQNYWDVWSQHDSDVPSCWKMMTMVWLFQRVIEKWYNATPLDADDIGPILAVLKPLKTLEEHLHKIYWEIKRENERFEAEMKARNPNWDA